ncbi:LEAF RUST 10 DISEASE-RESISTANCE LOCUS RECEPTOR-LIKE PROTEIN KINASE-like 2.4 [Hibiscus syriacus]|uniref:LEAF RUST 10 DISEASE-RESISTANCE LOCUS RECEPTOR-LIKE PROTEIN KINASE-like 2.4 n=1 Tax=Hibiscus syriacus TaxID=106335 RepID=UPI0019217D2B|nr:LEAF RUST 10 DISEASE-RESISTANCE LOCUS RECEPTOR-LIKE PROTEIN KINASE-like 2.4 [Hibiscus syriacus]
MHYQPLVSVPSMSVFTFFLFSLLFFFHLPISYTQDDGSFERCFESFSCGDLSNLMFPFWKEDSPEICHQPDFGLTRCDEDQPAIDINGAGFRLISFNETGWTMTIAREDLWGGICPSSPIGNISLGFPFFQFSLTNRNLTFFYDCDSPVVPRDAVRFQCDQSSLISFYADDLVRGGSYDQFSRSCRGGAVRVQINQSHFERLQDEGPENVGFGRWRLGFDVGYNLPEIFCEKCQRNRSSCDELTGPQYPVCRNPGTHKYNLLRPPFFHSIRLLKYGEFISLCCMNSSAVYLVQLKNYRTIGSNQSMQSVRFKLLSIISH